MIMITPREFENRMKAIADIKDLERRHVEADDLMCEVLDQQSYAAGVEIFKKMELWYS